MCRKGLSGQRQKLRQRGMWQVGGQFAGHPRMHIGVMAGQIGHQVTRLIALPFAMADHGDPPRPGDSGGDGFEELGVARVRFFAVSIMAFAVDVVRKAMRVCRCS